MSLAYGNRQPCDEPRIEARRQQVSCPRRDKPWVLVTAILGSSIAFIEGSGVNLALPAIQAHFAASSVGLQWVINAYMLTLGAFMLIGGSLGDRYGLRRIFLAGVAIFGIGATACAFAPSISWLILARLVQGFGGALLVPASLALIGSHFSAQERGRAIGTWAGASALTTALGPVLGGWLVDQWNWQAVFLLVLPLSAITFAVALWRVPASSTMRSDRLDYPAAVLLAVALALLIYLLVGSGSLLRQGVLLVLALLSGMAFIWRERTFSAPMLPLGLFRSYSFSGANLMTLLLYCALSGALYFLPFNLIQVHGYSAVAAGAAFLPFTIILGFGSTFAGGLIRRFNPRIILTIGPAVTAMGFFLLAVPGEDAGFVGGFLPGIVLIGVGMTLSVAPLTTVVMNSVNAQQNGIASGVNNTAARLAGVIAVAVFTALAIEVFSGRLGPELQAAGIAPELVGQLVQAAPALADLKAPQGASAAVATAVGNAVASAYVGTFRWIAVACGILALLSAAVAWLLISDISDDRQHEHEERA